MNVYRFRDFVAITPPLGSTFYITTDEARQVSRAMNRVAREVERGIKFTDSQIKTMETKDRRPRDFANIPQQ